MSRAASAWFLAVALCAFLLSWSFLHHGTLQRNQIVDTPVYEGYGDAVMAGKIPYSDFKLEYPPAAVPVFVLPDIGREGGTVAYGRWFGREQAPRGTHAMTG